MAQDVPKNSTRSHLERHHPKGVCDSTVNASWRGGAGTSLRSTRSCGKLEVREAKINSIDVERVTELKSVVFQQHLTRQKPQPHRGQQQQPVQGRRVEKGKEKQEEEEKEMGKGKRKGKKERVRKEDKTERKEGKEEELRTWLRRT